MSRLRRATRWLRFAAAPTFAVMAGATALQAVGSGPLICGPDASEHGMALMYLLMSVFHLGPWLAPSRQTGRSSH